MKHSHQRAGRSGERGFALLLMFADTLARVIIPGCAELPVGILTALLGGRWGKF